MEKSIQLEIEFPEFNTPEMQIAELKNKLDKYEESVGKIRRKLFAEWNDMKKIVDELRVENLRLKDDVNVLKSNFNSENMFNPIAKELTSEVQLLQKNSY